MADNKSAKAKAKLKSRDLVTQKDPKRGAVIKRDAPAYPAQKLR